MTGQPRMVEVRQNVLKRNDEIARELRERFRHAGVFVISLVSSPGSGKTALLEKTLTLLQPRRRVAALVGDLATDNDAARLARAARRCGRSSPARCATWRRRWSRRARATGIWAPWTTCSSRTSGTSYAPLPTIWARACGGADVGDGGRRQAAEVSDDLQQRRTWRWLRRSIWRKPSSSTRGRRLRTFRQCGPVCRYSRFRPRPGPAWRSGSRRCARKAFPLRAQMADETELPKLSEPELQEAQERSSATARVVYEAVRREGEDELSRSRPPRWHGPGLAAGLSMGFSLIIEGSLRAGRPAAPWRPLVAKLGYAGDS